MTDKLEALPLYRKLAQVLATRIAEGYWNAGDLLPSEFVLADEFDVSQGTARKAMGELETLGIVERRQGRGSFVTTNTAERSFYHFFRLARPDGSRIQPEPLSEQIQKRPATALEQQQLQLAKPADVIEIVRVRTVDDKKIARETMIIPCQYAMAITDQAGPLPNSLYPFYQQNFGIMILRAEDQISAISATPEIAEALQIELGTPVLQVLRRAHDIKDRIVELRTSQFCSDQLHYNVALR